MQPRMERTPASYARLGDASYPVIIVIGVFGQGFVRDRLVIA
jgi:hypothetical protein